MLNPIVSLIVFQCEMLIAYWFFSNVSYKRYPRTVCLLMGAGLYTVCALINILSVNNIFLNSVFFLAVNIAYPLICFQLDVRHSVFYSFCLLVISSSMEFIMVAAISAVTITDFKSYNNSLSIFILECPASKILYFIGIFALARFINPDNRKIKIPMTMLFYPLSTMVCHWFFWYICNDKSVSAESQFLLVLACMILFAANLILFITYQDQLEKESELLQMRGELSRLQTEKSYYDILDQQNRQLRIYAHDAKNHLQAIQSLNSDPRISGYLSTLSAQLADYTKYCHSGNKLLDVMISKYSLTCENKNLYFDYDVKLCGLTGIEDIDLVAILGNLMDNAMTAAEQSSDKWISLETAKRNAYQVLIIHNSSDDPPVMEGNSYVTTKQNKTLHGIGLKSVAQTLKKYNGDFDCSYDPDSRVFTVTAMIGEPVTKDV